MAWQPQEAGLVQLCNLLAASQRGENPAQVRGSALMPARACHSQGLSRQDLRIAVGKLHHTYVAVLNML